MTEASASALARVLGCSCGTVHSNVIFSHSSRTPAERFGTIVRATINKKKSDKVGIGTANGDVGGRRSANCDHKRPPRQRSSMPADSRSRERDPQNVIERVWRDSEARVGAHSLTGEEGGREVALAKGGEDAADELALHLGLGGNPRRGDDRRTRGDAAQQTLLLGKAPGHVDGVV